ncbi:MAG TPA: hypothetical protein VFN19_06630 [Candidatus Nanopelagicales bacterium]|nr:hypothetical protein [Candidatus Nanopelagicales bacterium]
MNGRVGRTVLALVTVLAGLVLAGCGVPLQDSATPVPGVSPPPGQAPTAPSTNSTQAWFVRNGQLVPVMEPVDDTVTPGVLLELLAAGPPDGSPDGMRSLVADPLAGEPLVTAPADPVPVPQDGQVVVQLSPKFNALAASEQVLLIGQVVMTLTSAGAAEVLFVDAQGAPAAVPLPDGRVLDRPATRADYRPLTEPPPTTAATSPAAASPTG